MKRRIKIVRITPKEMETATPIDLKTENEKTCRDIIEGCKRAIDGVDSLPIPPDERPEFIKKLEGHIAEATKRLEQLKLS